MKLLTSIAAVAFTVVSAATFAVPSQPESFWFKSNAKTDYCVFGSDEANCKKWKSSKRPSEYLDPKTAEGLKTAQWIYAKDGDKDSNYVLGSWKAFEVDLEQTGEKNWINRLFVAYDDQLKIRVGSKTIWNSEDHEIKDAWKKSTNVIKYLDAGGFNVGKDASLKFLVKNTGRNLDKPGDGGPTGVIWKGYVAVPEPGSVALLGLGLIGLGFARKKTKAA